MVISGYALDVNITNINYLQEYPCFPIIGMNGFKILLLSLINKDESL